MFLPSWRDRFSHPTTNRAARRRRKRQPRLQTLEPRSLLSVTPTAVTFTPIEQTAFSGTVASFTADDAGPFTANIDWGDGTTTTGTVAANGSGFDVSDTHTYAEDGTDAVSVVIADAADSTSATAASTANVSENGFGLTAGPAISATEGVAISGFQAATFSDPGSPDAAGDFAASIDWGDGTTSAGTISGSGGSFTVTGDHTYADELSGNYAVTVSEPSANFTFGPISAAVTVAEGDSGSLNATTITPTEGQAFSGAVATFTDNFSGQVAGDFTANVDWGDGTTTVGTVTGGSGTFTISGDHTYADEGTFSVLASFADDAPSTLNATITSTATVGEADALIGTGTTIAPIETTPFSGAVATFSDTNPVANPADFSANIDWGDGTIDVGVPVTGGAGADLTVSGTHTYAEEGAYTIVTTLADDSPSTVSATATSTANVGEFSLGITGVPVVTTEGQVFSGIVATASDPGSTDPASEFGATIDWGDGTTTTGTVSGSAGAYTISGDHTYADEGSFTANVSFLENNSPGFPISVTTPVTVAEGDTLTPGIVTTGSISENQFVGGLAAVFHDAGYPNNDIADFTGTFDWGDGTVSTTSNGNVSLSSDGAGDITLSVAGHSYADEGVYTVVATVADDAPGTASSSQTGTLTVMEADAFTPAATPLTIATTEGTAFSGNVAVFADTGYPDNDPSDFNASIDWGDGTTDTGSVSTSGDGNFTVSGSHTYTDDGSRIITTTISDDAPGTATGTTTATANIAEADLTLTPAVATFVVREGATASGTVATITDLGGNDPAGDFTAMIDWGDGTTTSGTVTGAAGIYQVAGSHSYDDEGTFTVSVTATETGPGASATATMTANVIEGDVFTSSAAPITVAENTVFTGSTLATFTDTGFPGNVAADFTAAVDWGDGTTAVGVVSGSAGTFTVSGNHTYADEGSYPVTITLSDDAPSTLVATATTTATVTEGDTFVAGTAVTANATEAASFSGTVATFSDTTYPGNTAGDFNAMIDWGDGTTTAGSISGTAGEFTVSGSHTYAEEGTMTASVVVSDDAPGTATGTATATINVADAPLSATGVTLAATEGAAFNTVVANFTDADPAGTAGDYTATVVWGDGTTALGTVSANGSGFQVTAAHDYAEEGTDTITVTIADVGGSTATATSTAQVSDAALTATGTTIAPTEGIAFTGAVASFSDADPAGTPSDYTATITWGDGTTSAGTIAANGSGGFDVSATHVYAEEGTDSVSVTINDIGGASATAVSTAHVADASLSATAAAVSSPEFATFSGTVANFTDADPNGTVSDYTATIDWGDGSTPTAGTITAAGSSFDVSGSHAYAEDGSFIIKVTVADVGGATATVSRAATITEPAITGSGVTLAGFERSPMTNITVATFQHGDGGEPAGNFTATIEWGDGSSSVGTISQSGTAYSVSGSHIYLDEKTYPVTVKVSDDAASATFASSAKISEELLPNGTVGTPNEQFISELYRDLLHRPVDSTALPYWSNLLDQGQSRQQVAQAIINSAMPGELGEDLVRGMFETLLNRDPDTAGMAFWLNILNGHETIEQTEASIAGTQEFYADSGGTNDGFVTHLFQVALNRTPEASALAAFDASLAGGMSREQVAEIVFGSHEYHLREISGNYQSSFDLDDRFVANVPFNEDLDFLDRAPDAGGLAGFTSALDNGATDQQVWAQFLASDEFFAKLS